MNEQMKQRLDEALEYVQYHLKGKVELIGAMLMWDAPGQVTGTGGTACMNEVCIVNATPLMGLFGGSHATWRQLVIVDQMDPPHIVLKPMKRSPTVQGAVEAFIAHLPKSVRSDPMAQLASGLVDVSTARTKVEL